MDERQLLLTCVQAVFVHDLIAVVILALLAKLFGL